MNNQIQMLNKYYFVGIGGIGMSALAEYMQGLNNQICGCDSDIDREIIYNLQKKNIFITNEENVYEELLKINPNFIVITNTVLDNHPAIIFAKKFNIKILKRSELLGNISNDKNLIGITGSHGKTSTTGLISHIFIKENRFPTIFVGGIMPLINNNFIKGTSNDFILEADDAYKSFLDLTPSTSIVTNISYEHLETYKDWNDIENSFLQYINNTKINGNIIINNDDEVMKKFSKKINREFITYGLEINQNNYSASNILLNDFNSEYTLFINQKEICQVCLSIPGIHQIKNSLAAIIASMKNNIPIENIVKYLNSYNGVNRRFEFIGYLNKCKIYDDYGHHPKELNMIFETLCNAHKNNKKIVFFQPHKYTRTKFLWNDFIEVFNNFKYKIDKFYITDVYAAGDLFDKEYNSQELIKNLKSINVNSEYIPFEKDFFSLILEARSIKNNLNENDAILCLGAGLLDNFAKILTLI